MAARGRALFVLDGFEPVAEHAAATLERWLERAADGCFLATSRERLGVKGEGLLMLGPLEEPAAMELFVERARAVRPGLSLQQDERDPVQRLVRLLERQPLAIELAAARMRAMSPSQIAARLGDRFRLLADDKASGRHATLQATIDWSWDLLDPWEKAALAQCSVFEAGFTLEAAEEVLDLAAWPEAPWPMDVVQALLDKSLVQAGSFESEPRFSLLVSIQEYGRSRLGEADGAGGMRSEATQRAEERHGRYYARFGAAEFLETLDGPDAVARRQALSRELDNLVAACRRALLRADGTTAAATYRAASHVFGLTGPTGSAIDLGREVAALEVLTPEERAVVLGTLAHALDHSGRRDEARECYERTLGIYHRLGDRRGQAGVLDSLGFLDSHQGDTNRARERLETALGIYSELGDRRGEGKVLTSLGYLLRLQGRMDEGRRSLERALAIKRELGIRHSQSATLVALGDLLEHQGRMDEAREKYNDALVIRRGLGDRAGEAQTLCSLGILHHKQGRIDEARQSWETALEIDRELGRRPGEGSNLANLGHLHHEQQRMDQALECYKDALEIQREVGNRHFVSIVLTSLGILWADLNRFEEARDHFQRALTMHRESGNRPSEAIVLLNMGSLSLDQGDHDSARDHYRRALAISREVGDRGTEGVVLHDMGSIHHDEGDMEAACDHYQRALAIHREVGDRRSEGIVLGLMGKLDLEQGRLEEARDHLEAALAIHREVGDRSYEGRTLGGLGLLLARQGSLEDADPIFTAGEELLRQVGPPSQLACLLARRYEAELEAGELARARASLSEAEALAAELGAGPDSPLGRWLAQLRQRVGGAEAPDGC
jgi:tetratricopeptide (TPR) repeat protein